MYLQKFLTPLLFLPLFLLTSCNTDEYWQFHEQKTKLTEQKQTVEQNLATFSVDTIEPREVEILATPDKKVLDRIVSMIE